MSKRTNQTTNDAPPSGAPREAHQRAGVDLIRELIRFCKRGPYSKPCVVFGDLNGHFVKV